LIRISLWTKNTFTKRSIKLIHLLPRSIFIIVVDLNLPPLDLGAHSLQPVNARLISLDPAAFIADNILVSKLTYRLNFFHGWVLLDLLLAVRIKPCVQLNFF
jgi:hypothetical protein